MFTILGSGTLEHKNVHSTYHDSGIPLTLFLVAGEELGQGRGYVRLPSATHRKVSG